MLEYKKWAEMDYWKKWKITQLRTSSKNMDYELGAYKLEMTEEKEWAVSVNHRILVCVPVCYTCKKPLSTAHQGGYIWQR